MGKPIHDIDVSFTEQDVRDSFELELRAAEIPQQYYLGESWQGDAPEQLLLGMYKHLHKTHGSLAQVVYRGLLDPQQIEAISGDLYCQVTGPLKRLVGSTKVSRHQSSSIHRRSHLYSTQVMLAPDSVDDADESTVSSSGPPAVPAPRELRRTTFDGMIKHIDGATATVVLSTDGRREPRTMSTEELAKNDVRFEGQAFTIVVRELQRPNGRVRKEIEIDPVGDPTTRTVKALRPDSDFTKFRNMP